MEKKLDTFALYYLMILIISCFGSLLAQPLYLPSPSPFPLSLYRYYFIRRVGIFIVIVLV